MGPGNSRGTLPQVVGGVDTQPPDWRGGRGGWVGGGGTVNTLHMQHQQQPPTMEYTSKL